MKNSSKTGRSKLNPKNFVKRVLSRTPNSSQSGLASTDSKSSLKLSQDPGAERGEGEMQNEINAEKLIPAPSSKFQSELAILRSQIECLQLTMNQVQDDNRKKEKALSDLAKEKEQLTLDLKRQKRSNINLKQQLEDERNFYYKEKEHYCNEMNTYKKRYGDKLSPEKKSSKTQNLNAQKEIDELKGSLNQTLEANYNLSIKFLRMKNTKLCLKQQLEKMKSRHDSAMKFYKDKVDEVQKQIDFIIDDSISIPTSASSKKYIHLLKQNGKLMHELLHMQYEIDRLNHEVERLKFVGVRNDTNKKLKLIHHNENEPKLDKAFRKCNKCQRTKSESIRTTSTSPLTTIESKSFKSRSSQTPSSHRSRHSISFRMDKQKPKKSEHEVQVSINEEKDKEKNSTSIAKPTSNPVENESKYDLMRISNSNMSYGDGNMYPSCSSITPEALKWNLTRSAPEVRVQYDDNI